MSENNESVAIPTPDAATIATANSLDSLAKVLGTENKPFYCSFDLSTSEGRALLFRMDAEPDYQLKHAVKQTFRLKHVYASPAQKIDPLTQEVITLTRIVLVATDGKSYGCFSAGIREVIAKLAACFGLPPWKDGIPVEVYTTKTSKGFDLLKLRLAEETTPKGGKGK